MVTIDDESKTYSAVDCFEQCEAICEQFGLPAERARNQRAWARYELMAGNLASAQTRWETARNLYDEIGADAEFARMPEQVTATL